MCLPTNCHIGLDLHVASALHMHACVRACVRACAGAYEGEGER